MGNSSSSSRSSEEEQEIKVPPQTQTVQSPPAPTQRVPTQASAPSGNANVVESQVVDTYKRPPRLTAWFCLLAASVIVLTSSIRFVIETRSALWILVVSIISIVFSILAIIGHNFLKHKFVGKVWGEGILSYLLFLCWIGGLAVCMSPTRALAVSRTQFGLNVVINANLYFSSWFAFVCIFYIVASWTMTYWKKAAEVISAITGRLAKWWCILIVSIIVLVSSAQFHISQDCHNEGSTDLGNQACKSNKYAIALGACGSVLTIVVIVLAHFGKIRFLVESISTVVMFIFYTAGIAIITYKNGPGVTIGNLYFATWAGFIITVLLCIDCYHEFMKHRAKKKAAKPPKKGKSSRKKKESKKQVSTKQQVQTPQPTQEPAVPQANRGFSMRSSLDTDEFCDARDDLDLNL